MIIRPPAHERDRAWMRHVWETSWGGLSMVSRGSVYHLESLHALMALDDDGVHMGLATWSIRDGQAELVSLNALVENQGVGSALVAGVEERVRESGGTRLWLITSNDNLRALAFYQKRGYRLVELLPGAVDQARAIKSDIPQVADNGIPIHDEILLAKDLT